MTAMENQCLATLQTLVQANGADSVEARLLEQFYRHCARQPMVLNRAPLGIAFQTLLYRYPFLQPSRREFLAAFVANHWRRFAPDAAPPTPAPEAAIDANDAASDPGDEAEQHDAAPVPAADASPAAVDDFAFTPVRQDWFDRFLDFVRILLFR
jgi:hypothetical protein